MVRVYSRHYVFYHEIEDDNIRRIVDDFQVLYGNYNDVCFESLLETLEHEFKEDYNSILEFLMEHELRTNYMIDMSMI